MAKDLKATIGPRSPGLWRLERHARRVRSVKHGVLNAQFVGNTMVVTLPIALTDMLLIDR